MRPLGSFENLFDLYTQRLPVQFSMIAELDRVVSAEEITAALAKLQASQPLLAVGVHRSEAGATFYRTQNPIHLVIAAPSTPWEQIATHDQAWAIDVTKAPLARCTLAAGSHSSTIVMTFAHQIADGISAAAALRDLVRALNGWDIADRLMPESQETLLIQANAARLSSSADDSPEDRMEPPLSQGGLLEDAHSPVLSRQGSTREFDSTEPDISTLVWSPELTSSVLAQARLHSTTLHSLLTAAAVRVLFSELDRESLAVMNPMDIRQAASTGDSLALYFLSTRMGFLREKGDDIWAVARAIRQQVSSAHTLEQLAGMSSGMSAATGSISQIDDAVHAMVAFANYDVMVSNLGDLGSYELPATRTPKEGAALDAEENPIEVGITDMFGPTMATQIEGEQILAVSTFNGRLRTTITTRNAVPELLLKIRAEVVRALDL